MSLGKRSRVDAMDSNKPIDVLVVGAGLSGLTAAVCLQAAGLRVRILEGAGSVGGRIKGISGIEQNTILADLGPTWVWPRWQPVVERWMGRLSLAQFPQYEAGDGILDGYGGPPRRYPLPGQDGIARIVGGPSALVQALAAQLDPDTIMTNARVVEIKATSAGIEVITADGALFEAAHLILAAPLRLIEEQICIAGLPPELLAALRATPTWMAQQAKAVALYDEPFWRGEDLSGRVASRTGPLMEVHDHTPASGDIGALFGFVGWDAAARLQDPKALRQTILDQRVRCFGPRAEKPMQLVIQDWAQEPLTCSAADLREPPLHPDIGPAILRQPHLDGRLWFAVSESADISPGLIEGALSAGEMAAQRLLVRI